MQLHETSVSLLLSCTLPYVLTQACTHRTQATLLTMVCILRYRRIVSNNCTDGLREKYTAKAQMCPGKAPHGLHVATTDGRLVAEQGHNATFIILMEEVGQSHLGPQVRTHKQAVSHFQTGKKRKNMCSHGPQSKSMGRS